MLDMRPREFFETLEHELGKKARPEYLAFRPGEVILKQRDPVRQMMLVRYGDVEISHDGKPVCVYVSDPETRNGALPILSASDYCYGRPSGDTYVALTEVEIMTIDTRMLIDMGKRETILVLMRNMILFSDMGADLRQKIKEEFETTGLICFNPQLPESKILRHEGATFEEYYLDFALRTMFQLLMGRMVRSDHRSTAIVALPRAAWMTKEKRF